jgi:hypothetical protein
LDEALDLLPSGPLKTKINDALERYLAAAHDWDNAINWQSGGEANAALMSVVRHHWEWAKEALISAEGLFDSEGK